MSSPSFSKTDGSPTQNNLTPTTASTLGEIGAAMLPVTALKKLPKVHRSTFSTSVTTFVMTPRRVERITDMVKEATGVTLDLTSAPTEGSKSMDTVQNMLRRLMKDENIRVVWPGGPRESLMPREPSMRNSTLSAASSIPGAISDMESDMKSDISNFSPARSPEGTPEPKEIRFSVRPPDSKELPRSSAPSPPPQLGDETTSSLPRSSTTGTVDFDAPVTTAPKKRRKVHHRRKVKKRKPSDQPLKTADTIDFRAKMLQNNGSKDPTTIKPKDEAPKKRRKRKVHKSKA